MYAGGPVIGGGRFTPKGGAHSLYIGETAHTAKLEKRQAAGFSTVRRNAEPIEVNYALDVELSSMLDLADPAVANKLETTSVLRFRWRMLPKKRK